MADVRPPDWPGLPSRFVFDHNIAEGGMAYVSLVWDRVAMDWRALKTLKPEMAHAPALLERFEREGRAMMRIVHPNVVRVYDVVRAAGTVHLVMEYAEGGDLVDWLEANNVMAPATAAQVALEICEGVEAAHALGIIHRDIKPQNVVVDRIGHAKLTDFGIARAISEPSQTHTGSGMGTLGFMAPEQHSSAKHVDERADVYSIAATLYTLLRGVAPSHLFMAEDVDYRGVPQVLIDVITKASEYDRNRRYQSVRELREALEEAVPQLTGWDTPEHPSLAPAASSSEATVSRAAVPVRSRTAPTPHHARAHAEPRGERSVSREWPVSSLPSREAIAPKRRFFPTRIRDRARSQRRWMIIRRAWGTGLLIGAAAATLLVGWAVWTQFRLDQLSIDLALAETQRDRSLVEHTRYLTGALGPVREVDPVEVDRLLGLLASVHADTPRALRDERMFDVVDSLNRLSRRLSTTDAIAALRRVEAAAKDLTRDNTAYMEANETCTVVETSAAGRFTALMPLLSGKCVPPSLPEPAVEAQAGERVPPR